MTDAKIEWDYDAFYEKLHAFERCGVAFVTGDGTPDARLLTRYAADIARDIGRVIAAAPLPGHAKTVRVLICADEAAARAPKVGDGWITGSGLKTRIDLLDTPRRELPPAAFHSVSLVRRGEGAWPPAGTPERCVAMRDLARRVAEVIGDKLPAALSNADPAPITLRVYFGAAWDRELRPLGKGQPADVLRFEDHRSLVDYFTASVPRTPPDGA
jgi:hypothetical protein